MIDWRKETQAMLKANVAAGALLGENVYLVVCQKEEGFPRVVIREVGNNPAFYGDGKGWEAYIRLRLWIWAKTYDEWIATIAAVDDAMSAAGWSQKVVGEDDWVPAAGVYEKEILYSKFRGVRKKL